MGEIVFVRHGQANSAATDEDGYDRLSDLGRQQAQWLGDWIGVHEAPFDHVLSGTLRRHRQTADAMGITPEEDARLNELDYFNLLARYQVVKGTSPSGPEEFADHMPRVFAAWHAAEIEGAEPYHRFEARVGEMLAEAAIPGRRLLCITSGGVIGMVLRHLLDLDLIKLSDVMLPIYNTSLHRIRVRPERTYLTGFNATPHLDLPERAHARTHF